jgi:hypothetical protein
VDRSLSHSGETFFQMPHYLIMRDGVDHNLEMNPLREHRLRDLCLQVLILAGMEAWGNTRGLRGMYVKRGEE